MQQVRNRQDLRSHSRSGGGAADFMIESSSTSHISRLTSHNPLPPRLSMDEYADFVEASLREANPAHAARQKELEERIRRPFCIGGGIPSTDEKDGRRG